jgi:flagellin-like hook-associated protein FlgL
MSKDANDRLCNHENVQLTYDQNKFTNNSSNNNNGKSSLKRTESEIDEINKILKLKVKWMIISGDIKIDQSKMETRHHE